MTYVDDADADDPDCSPDDDSSLALFTPGAVAKSVVISDEDSSLANLSASYTAFAF